MQESIESLDEAQIGRILHFVIEDHGKPQCRPGIVVEDWPGSGRSGYVNLIVFPDGSNDGRYGVDQHYHKASGADLEVTTSGANVPLLVRWETSVTPQHAIKAIRTWHWPRECGKLIMPDEPFRDPDEGLLHHNHGAGLIDENNCFACRRKAARSATVR